ncbi:MAG: patatin-like phospholipase family protein [Spirochaetia bacterium]|nr:patatin-like phospholipase family protein [Spirochaetia bacterium]
MRRRNTSFCLVLAGGGSKGIYHLGVWKALREMGIEVDAFVGTSIGAVVAGLLAQNQQDSYESFVDSISLDSIVALPPGFVEKGKLSVGREAVQEAPKLFRSLIAHQGLDTSPLRKLLESHIDEAKIRASGKDLGIITVDLSSLKPREMFLEDMEEGRVLDYLMASAAFPGFKSPVIEGKKYMDGGVFENIPYDMARKRGYRRLIVSDIGGLGRNRKVEGEGSLTAYIKSSINMGWIFDFDREFLKDFMQLGYLDTLRSFGRLSGYSYFIKPGKMPEFPVAPLPESMSFPKEMEHERLLLHKYLECAALVLEIPRIRLYDYKSLFNAVKTKLSDEEAKIENLVKGEEDRIKATVNILRESVKTGVFKESPYYNYRIIEEILPPSAWEVTKKAIAKIHPELSAGLYFLERLAAGQD